jgi:hypothetical protein
MKSFKKKAVDKGRRERVLREPLRQSATFSYHSRRSEIPGSGVRNSQTENQKPDLKRQTFKYPLRQRLGAILVIFVIFVLVVMVLRLSGTPKIVVLSSAEQKPFLESTTVYGQAADKRFDSSFLNDNKVTINTGDISRHLLSEFPELTSVSISIPLLSDQAVVYVQPAQPAIVFNASNGSFVLDTSGTALQLASQFSNLSALGLPTITDQSAYQVKIGDQALTSSDVTFIQTVVYELAIHKVGISSFNLPAGSSELDAIITGEPYFVKFNLENNDARQQAGTYLAVKQQLLSQNVTPAHYIDVRVDGRAYYE